eukprot:3883343-Alexandrium_andersonii.AAC.1
MSGSEGDLPHAGDAATAAVDRQPGITASGTDGVHDRAGAWGVQRHSLPLSYAARHCLSRAVLAAASR